MDNGCGCKERKCPCRGWVNCRNYVDMERQAWRLKKKRYEYDFQRWYEENFRGHEGAADFGFNG